MFSIRRPSAKILERYRVDREARALNAPRLSVASLDAPPAGFVSDTYGGLLGAGAESFAAAVAALEGWAMYPVGWAWVHAGAQPLAAGSVYVAVIRGYGIHSMLPGRVLETFDDPGPERRFGFTFATVTGHPEQGVERFQVSWSGETDEVRFDARAISRPGPLLRLAAPLARRLQVRFHRESTDSIRAFMAKRS